MLKPERAWAVGDKFFSTYGEARTYIASRRGELSREALADTIQGEIIASGMQIGMMAAESAENIADAILTKFKLTPRK